MSPLVCLIAFLLWYTLGLLAVERSLVGGGFEIMNFPLRHTGCRFFFFTFVVKERAHILSTLQRHEKRPQLTPLGEFIRVLWKTLHAIDSHLTPSDFVIMPDHVHLLLMVNAQEAFPFNPLVFVHWFKTITTHRALYSNPESLKDSLKYPLRWDYSISKQCTLKGDLSPLFQWEEGAWINFSFDARQLSAIRRYIKMNPVRYFWKHDHPDLFRTIHHLKHPKLDPRLTWTATGDITILASPFLYLVRLTRKASLEALEPEIQHYLSLAQQGWVPLSGFLSPGERLFEKRLKQLPHARWVKAVPYGLPEHYDPSVEDSRWISTRQQLILSSFNCVDYPPFQITRAGCLLMNERIAAITQR